MSAMGPLANRKFREWTEGLDIRESMISIFTHIRDIPYALVSGPRSVEDFIEAMLRDGQGSCAPKHYLLAAMYRKLSVSVAYATFPFLWGEQEVKYPPALRRDAAGLPVAYHLACRVQIGCRWALVDATWDPPLAKAGFPVNLHWDGIAETRCAVRPLQAPGRAVPAHARPYEPCRDPLDSRIIPVDGEKDHWEAEDREQYYRQNVGKRSPADREHTAKFYEGLNVWMKQVRESVEDTGTR